MVFFKRIIWVIIIFKRIIGLFKQSNWEYILRYVTAPATTAHEMNNRSQNLPMQDVGCCLTLLTVASVGSPTGVRLSVLGSQIIRPAASEQFLRDEFLFQRISF
jgi:hypothetical protein